MSLLSTTVLLGQLNTGQFKEFVSTVKNNFEKAMTDDISALKVIKTVAVIVYQKELGAEEIENIVNIVIKCTDIVINKEAREDVFLKELYGNVFHLMTRLINQEQVR